MLEEIKSFYVFVLTYGSSACCWKGINLPRPKIIREVPFMDFIDYYTKRVKIKRLISKQDVTSIKFYGDPNGVTKSRR
jgi:hypothetical protein